MSHPPSTQDKLLKAARDLFWTRGYSNVSVREITKAAGVDVALVSRYFGNKEGLFDATLAEIPPWSALTADPGDVLTAAVESFSQPFDPETDQANPFTMLVANVIDPHVGDKIRTIVQTGLADPLSAKLGGDQAETQASLILATLFGMALMRKNFQLSALTNQPPDQTKAQLHHLASAALSYRDEG